MKKKFTIFFIQLFISALFALDYRQVLFSNNFERIERVNNSESILRNHYETIITFIKKKVDNHSQVSYEYPEFKYKELYSEDYDNGKLYRLLIADEPITQDKILNMSFKYICQVVFIISNDTLNLVDYAFFHYRGDHEGMWASSVVDVYEGIEVISRNNKIKGLMSHKSEVEVRTHSDEGGGKRWIENNGNSNAKYYEWADLQNLKKYALVSNNVYLFDGYNNHIEIHSTRPLIDKKRPLMYTIQNAFDGNPATAYVEDTDDDLLFISVYNKKFKNVTCMSLINGYSGNEDLYLKNNRVKKIGDYYISSEGSKRVYSDKYANIEDIPNKKQIVKFDDSIFAVMELYNGTKYSDTCLSELDFYDKKSGWLFGE